MQRSGFDRLVAEHEYRWAVEDEEAGIPWSRERYQARKRALFARALENSLIASVRKVGAERMLIGLRRIAGRLAALLRAALAPVLISDDDEPSGFIVTPQATGTDPPPLRQLISTVVLAPRAPSLRLTF